MLASVSDSVNQVAIYAGSSIVASAVVGVTLLLRGNRKTRRDEQTVIDTELADKVIVTAQQVKEMFVALVGAPPTDLNPHPEPGLVEKVEQYQASNVIRKEIGDRMIREFEVWKDSQKDLDTKVDALNTKVDSLSTHVAALVYDTKPNSGTTSRDSLDRIEKELKSAKDKVETISGSPDAVTLPDIADTLDRIEENTKPAE